MARPLKPLVRGGGYYPSRRLTPLVYPGGYTTANGGDQPVPPTPSGLAFVPSGSTGLLTADGKIFRVRS